MSLKQVLNANGNSPQALKGTERISKHGTLYVLTIR